ncbi:uncharacterized protein B0H18DRAFT_1215584 [Fomitopsis serialis]|uniref:uncharacterized protein n=1 Tax=Fomitopsis serialis TaxID=139415 RepID=UPI002008ADC7|nr:uncharacterized protein B0H18DRAFT_1215584 [Neoantrodia serialis]KAH9915197.1 hypothetical protein B0H18DRAFT_1215584 [Neoantrodia serialis]
MAVAREAVAAECWRNGGFCATATRAVGVPARALRARWRVALHGDGDDDATTARRRRLPAHACTPIRPVVPDLGTSGGAGTDGDSRHIPTLRSPAPAFPDTIPHASAQYPARPQSPAQALWPVGARAGIHSHRPSLATAAYALAPTLSLLAPSLSLLAPSRTSPSNPLAAHVFARADRPLSPADLRVRDQDVSACMTRPPRPRCTPARAADQKTRGRRRNPAHPSRREAGDTDRLSSSAETGRETRAESRDDAAVVRREALWEARDGMRRRRDGARLSPARRVTERRSQAAGCRGERGHAGSGAAPSRAPANAHPHRTRREAPTALVGGGPVGVFRPGWYAHGVLVASTPAPRPTNRVSTDRPRAQALTWTASVGKRVLPCGRRASPWTVPAGVWALEDRTWMGQQLALGRPQRRRAGCPVQLAPGGRGAPSA